MAILKHIASKSSNYGAALEYLIFKHDELRKTPILDQNGNRIMRDEFYLDGLNCEPYSFDAACQQLNREYQKNKNKSNLETKKVALNREIEQALGNIVRLESQKRSGYERYVLGKLSKEKFLELKQSLENEIVVLKQKKSEREKEQAVVQEELRQKKRIAGNTDVLLTADNLQQYVKKIEVDHKKNTCTEFVF